MSTYQLAVTHVVYFCRHLHYVPKIVCTTNEYKTYTIQRDFRCVTVSVASIAVVLSHRHVHSHHPIHFFHIGKLTEWMATVSTRSICPPRTWPFCSPLFFRSCRWSTTTMTNINKVSLNRFMPDFRKKEFNTFTWTRCDVRLSRWNVFRWSVAVVYNEKVFDVKTT